MSRLILIFTFILSFNLQAKVTQIDPKAELMKLNEGEMKLIEKRGAKTSELKHRYLELMSEKIGFIRERENKNYLGMKAEERRQRTKDSFFEESKAYYLKTKDYGFELLKNHPRYERKAEVYFTLALNARDFSKEKEEEGFYLDALRSTQKDSPVAHQSHIGLAEFYYNEKKFEEAHKYYKLIIQVTSDSWLPKHLYNMAWCELKLKKFSSSIELMKRAFDLAKDPSYLSNADDVLGHIGLFYIQADRAEEGIDFYLQKNVRPAYYLFKMSKNLAEKGQYELTKNTLNKALELSADKDKAELHADVRLFQLEFYRNFTQPELFVNTADAMTKEVLSNTQRDEATQRTREYAGYLQVRLTENAKKNIKNFDPDQLARVLKLFSILKLLDPPKAFQYAYYQGETNFAVRHYSDAILAYEEALTLASKDASQSEDMRKAIASLLNLLDEAELKPEEKVPHYIIAYSEHVRLWPKDEKSRAIYPKLFALVKTKDASKAQSVFEQYVQNFPQDQKEQQELCLALMDSSIDKKDINQLAQWTQKMDQGFLSFAPEKVEKAIGVLGGLLFESIEKKSDKDEAIDDYIELYKNPRYPQKIKAKSAFNASSLYLEQGKLKKAKEWFQTSLSIYPQEDLKELKSVLVPMSLKLALKLDLEGAKELLTSYLKKTTKSEEQSVALWEHNFLFALSLNQVADEESLFAKKNLLSAKEGKELQITKAKKYFAFGELEKYLALTKGLEESSLKPYTVLAKERLYFQEKLSFEELSKEKLPYVQNRFELEAYKNELKDFEKKRLKIASRFKEVHFNWALEDYLLKLKEGVERGQKLLKKMDKENGIRLAKTIPIFYVQAAKTIEGLEFNKIPADMRASFQEVMLQMAQNFKAEETKLKESISTLASKDYSFEIRKSVYTEKETEKKIQEFALSQLEFNKDCDSEEPSESDKNDWKYWKNVSSCFLSKGQYHQSFFYMGLATECASKLSSQPRDLLNLQGVLALHQQNWDEAFLKLKGAENEHNLMLFKLIFGDYNEAQNYYSKESEKDKKIKDLFLLIKVVSYAQN